MVALQGIMLITIGFVQKKLPFPRDSHRASVILVLFLVKHLTSPSFPASRCVPTLLFASQGLVGTVGLHSVNNHSLTYTTLFSNVLSCTVWCRIGYGLNAVIYSVSCVPDDSWSVNAQVHSGQVSPGPNGMPVRSLGVVVMFMLNEFTPS
jgi:hypothetical protein